MPVIKKKKIKKVKKALVARTQTKPKKNTSAYLECLKTCCRKGIKPKNIAQISHECKTNALAINKKMSAQKKKDLTELAQAHDKFRKVLSGYVKKY